MSSTVECIFAKANNKSSGRTVGYIMAGGFYPALVKTTKLRYRAQASMYDQIFISARGLSSKLRPSKMSQIESREEYRKHFIKGLAQRYALKGNFVWFQSAISGDAEMKQIADNLYDTVYGQEEEKTLPPIKQFFTSLQKKYEKFEGSEMENNIHTMVQKLFNENNPFKQSNLQEFVNNYALETGKGGKLKLVAAASEEEYEALIKSGVIDPERAAIMSPLEAAGEKANVIDMRAWVASGGENDRAVEIIFDATEGRLSKVDEAMKGEHGVGKVPSWTGGATYTTVEKNKSDIQESVKEHFLGEIKDIYNPIVRSIREVGFKKLNAEKDKKVTTLKPSELAKVVDTGDIMSGITELNAKANTAMDTWVNPDLDYPVKIKEGVAREKEKQTSLVTYIMHNMMNAENMIGRNFAQAHRVSGRGMEGDAWYAVVPMHLHPPGPKTPAYEFFEEGMTKSPQGTEILPGPSATLAMLVKYDAITPSEARQLAINQKLTFITGRYHHGESHILDNGASMSNCNAFASGSGMKHATTVAYAPGFVAQFYANLVAHLKSDPSKVKDMIKGNDLKDFSKNIHVNNFKDFWALPFISIWDTLERQSSEQFTWMAKGRPARETGGWITAKMGPAKK